MYLSENIFAFRRSLCHHRKMNNQQAFIFIGRSGCGKGTQASLLRDYLNAKGIVSSEHPLFYVETGDKFREFITGTSHSSRLSKEIMDQAERQPDFLAIWNWSRLLVENLMGDEHLLFDGTPRSLNEAKTLATALKFYCYDKPVVINLDVSVDWATTRLTERGRGDDKASGDIARRLAWYESDVVPALEYYQNDSYHRFLRINGEQAVEAVHQEIVNQLGI